MAKVFITGGTGLVGSHTAEALATHGHAVEVIARSSSHSDFLPDNVVLHRCALSDPSPICDKLADAEYFIHIAGLTKARKKQQFYNVNAEAVKIWLEALRRHAPKLKRFVLVSSQAATRPSPEPIDESAEPAPISDYGKSKLMGEKYACEFMRDVPITIIRPPAVYGPRDRDIFFYFQLAAKGLLPLVGNPERRFSVIYAEDLARAIVLVMEHPSAVGETFFVTDGEPHTWRAFAEEVGKAIGKRCIRIRLPGAILWCAGAIDETVSFAMRKPALLSFQKVGELLESWCADGTKIRKMLGFAPEFDICAGVEKTARWYRENGWI